MKTDALYRLNWEKVFGIRKPRGSLYPVPSEAGITVVQYEPDFKISCLFPPKKRDFTVEYRTDRLSNKSPRFFRRQIITPTLLMCHLIRRTHSYDLDLPYYLDNPNPSTKKGQALLGCINHHPACYCKICRKQKFRQYRIINQFYLFGVDDSKEDSVWAQPYRLNNVYEDGRCCFRKNHSEIPKPENLKQAHVQFWMDRFDQDFLVGVIPHKCVTRSHRYRHCTKYRWNHKCYYEGHHTKHICGRDENPDAYSNDCNCCIEGCRCYRKCDCCMEYCECRQRALEKECFCRCCSNSCDCQCICYLGEAFADKLANYVPDKEYLNYTKFIFGKKFLSTTKHVSGIFFSTDEELLSDIPSKYHKKNSKFDQKFVLGFAKESAKGLNVNLHSELTFSLGPKQYNVVA